MPRQRDYKEEYRRRKARGLARGLSLSQARGHPRGGEPGVRNKAIAPKTTKALERGLKQLRLGSTLKTAASSAGVTEEKLRRFVRGQELARYVGRRWVIDDQRAKIVQTASRGSIQKLTVKGLDQASLAGKYWDAIGRFVDTNSLELLAAFRGLGLTDTLGVYHPFELNPNTLHRLQSLDNQAFHEVYRAVA